ncbi:unnamed protein product [Macrosiphum euphorbiae]|uniref:Putative aromatic acid exporter C-terminal domain-containing protein n=1 Tax=Macrosiphum euphorbiae TaxID=13131 RepID=A0AAV0XTR7_9HEMI|nr:unnamed protein product [Macrosiphum euphorbiae]
MMAIILDEEEENCHQRRRTTWILEMLIKRKQFGEYHTLFNDLQDEETSFYKYFRMSQHQFYVLLSKITKQNTTFREAISDGEKSSIL